VLGPISYMSETTYLDEVKRYLWKGNLDYQFMKEIEIVPTMHAALISQLIITLACGAGVHLLSFYQELFL
jgi:hypothetical protein